MYYIDEEMVMNGIATQEQGEGGHDGLYGDLQ